MVGRALLERPQLRKFVKYTLASMVGTVFGQGSLALLTYGFDWSAVPANLVAVTCGAVPNYIANRYWTWQKRGKNHLWGEVVPFWVMTVLGLALSTLFVALTEDRTDVKWAINVASLGGFAVLWVAKFFVLDRLLFVAVAAVADEPDEPAVTTRP